MIKINNRKDLIFYFRDQIEEIGFVADIFTASTNRWYFGEKFFGFDKYTIDIFKLDYIEDSWTIKLTHSYPIYKIGTGTTMKMYGAAQLKEIAIGKITMYSTMELDILNINELLEYISNIDVVKIHLRKNKLKKINGRLGIKV